MMTQSEAQLITRAALWATRDLVLDGILMHECELKEVMEAQVILAGWTPENFVMAALAGVYGPLDD